MSRLKPTSCPQIAQPPLAEERDVSRCGVGCALRRLGNAERTGTGDSTLLRFVLDTSGWDETTTFDSLTHRRPSTRWNGELPTGQLPEQVALSEESDLRLALLGALSSLTQRQRAVIVLRYFDDLSEAEAASALGCSIGSVKSHASRGLQQLRATPGLADSLGVEVRDGKR